MEQPEIIRGIRGKTTADGCVFSALFRKQLKQWSCDNSDDSMNPLFVCFPSGRPEYPCCIRMCERIQINVYMETYDNSNTFARRFPLFSIVVLP